MGDVSPACRERIEHLSKLAIGQWALECREAKFEQGTIALCGLEPLFGDSLGNESRFLQQLHAVLLAILGPKVVSTGASSIAPPYGKADLGLAILWGVKQV